MKASVQTISEIEIRIDVEVPAEEVDRELGKQLASAGRKARVKGFRAGKAPKDLVKKAMAAEIASEATRALINANFTSALETVGKGRVVGRPEVEPGLALEGEPLKFAIIAEVKPDVSVHSWKGLEISAPAADVTPAALSERVNAIRERHKERQAVDDRAADTGDVCVVDFSGELGGEADPRLGAKDFEVKLGSGNMIPGWEDELVGLALGATKRFDITFPGDYRAADLAGQQVTFEVTLKSLFQEEVPEVDDDFAKDAGYASVEDMQEKLRESLAKELSDRRNNEIERRVVQILLERNPFEVPKSLVEAYAQDRARGLIQMWRMQGLPEARAMEFLQRNWGGITERAGVEARRDLVLEALARQEKLEVSDDELSAAVVERIKEHGERAGKMYEKPEMREALLTELTAKKALELVRTHASIVDAAPEAA
jgi:trigger factor